VDFVHNLPVTSFGFRDAHDKFMLGHIGDTSGEDDGAVVNSCMHVRS
jgi:hypothetical protein